MLKLKTIIICKKEAECENWKCTSAWEDSLLYKWSFERVNVLFFFSFFYRWLFMSRKISRSLNRTLDSTVWIFLLLLAVAFSGEWLGGCGTWWSRWASFGREYVYRQGLVKLSICQFFLFFCAVPCQATLLIRLPNGSHRLAVRRTEIGMHDLE